MAEPEAEITPRGRIKLDWVTPGQEEAAVKSVELEAARLEMLREQHQDWIKVQVRNLDNADRSHEAWVQMNERAINAWERMAAVLERMAAENS